MEALLILQVIVVVLMIAVILMQRSSNDGFTGGGGGASGGGLMTGRGQANLLTKTTSFLAAAFIINSLVLSYIATHTQREESLIDKVIQVEEESKNINNNIINQTEESAPAVPLSE